MVVTMNSTDRRDAEVNRYTAMTFVVCVVFAMAGPTSAAADTVFSLDTATDLSLGSGSIGLLAVSQILTPQVGVATPIDNINRLDSLVMAPYRPGIDNLGTYGAYAALMAPVATVLLETGERQRGLPYAVMYAEALLLTYGTKDLLKAVVPRHRPYTYFSPIPDGEEDDYYNSFPSGHTSLAFLGATFLSVTFALEYPDSRWRWPVTVASYSLAAGVGVSRVLSGSHFITDVLAGAAIGAFWGWLVPTLHL
jgi:undecaprenyl-diphosphatase